MAGACGPGAALDQQRRRLFVIPGRGSGDGQATVPIDRIDIRAVVK